MYFQVLADFLTWNTKSEAKFMKMMRKGAEPAHLPFPVGGSGSNTPDTFLEKQLLAQHSRCDRVARRVEDWIIYILHLRIVQLAIALSLFILYNMFVVWFVGH